MGLGLCLVANLQHSNVCHIVEAEASLVSFVRPISLVTNIFLVNFFAAVARWTSLQHYQIPNQAIASTSLAQQSELKDKIIKLQHIDWHWSPVCPVVTFKMCPR
jgi:hypothetical protein